VKDQASVQISATEAVHAEIDAIEQQIKQLQAAIEQYKDTDTAEVNWGHVGDLASASSALDEAIAYVGG